MNQPHFAAAGRADPGQIIPDCSGSAGYIQTHMTKIGRKLLKTLKNLQIRVESDKPVVPLMTRTIGLWSANR
jgi:hypothetical protein